MEVGIEMIARKKLKLTVTRKELTVMRKRKMMIVLLTVKIKQVCHTEKLTRLLQYHVKCVALDVLLLLFHYNL